MGIKSPKLLRLEEFHVLSKPLSRHLRLVCVALLALVCALPLCGLRAFAAEAPQGTQDTAPPPLATFSPLPPYPEDMHDELFPADVQTVIDGDTRHSRQHHPAR
jgi:hypothetical protein